MNNNSLNLTEQTTEENLRVIPRAFNFISIALSIWTLAANAFVLVSIYRNRQKKWTLFIRQVFSISISDFCVALTVLISLVTDINGWQRKPVYCVVFFYSTLSLYYVSVLHILGICILRNLKIKTLFQNVNEPSSNNKYGVCSIVFSWTFSFLIFLLPFLVSGIPDEGRQLNSCTPENLFRKDHGILTFYIATVFLTCLVITDIIYLITVYRLWSGTNRVASTSTSEEPTCKAGPSFVQENYRKNPTSEDRCNPSTSTEPSNREETKITELDTAGTRVLDKIITTTGERDVEIQQEICNVESFPDDEAGKRSLKRECNEDESTGEKTAKVTFFKKVSFHAGASPNTTLKKDRVTIKGPNKQNSIIKQNTLASRSSNLASVRQKRAILAIGVVLIVFNICTMPLAVAGYLRLDPKTSGRNIYSFGTLVVVNSAINPFVYALGIPFVKQSVKIMLQYLKNKFSC